MPRVEIIYLSKSKIGGMFTGVPFIPSRPGLFVIRCFVYMLQVFNACKEEFVYHSKYWGRSLEEEEFYQALRDFTHNGRRQITEVIPGLVTMLKRLREVISQMESYRFFSSSLLIVYDGSEPDHGRQGLQNGCVGNDDPSKLWTEHCTMSPAPLGWRINRQSHSPSVVELSEIRRHVDIRMIDFAHTTHRGLADDAVCYSGVDESYVLGLSTLIRAFDEMLEQLSTERRIVT